MRIPVSLQPWAAAPGIRAYARTLHQLERELAKVGAVPGKVELVEKMAHRPGLRGLLTLERADAADWWLVVESQADSRPLRIIAPFRRALTLPYSLEMGLKAKLEFAGSLRRNLLLIAHWELLPATAASRDLAARLDAYPLPKLQWRHDSGGIPILLKEGARLSPAPTREAWPSTWTIFSGAQGFVFNVGPRIARYVEAAKLLEVFLENWVPRPVPQATPRSASPSKPPPPPAVERPAASRTAEGGLEVPDPKDLDSMLGPKGPTR